MKKAVAIILSVIMLALSLCACGSGENTDLKDVTVGVKVGSAPYMEIFYSLEIRLQENGYRLIYKEFDSSAQANAALEKGEIDFSCITTRSELDASNNDALVELGPIYYCPYAVFLLSYAEKREIEDGAVISIPSDADGMARALMLLDENGFITLKEGVGLSATLEDIEKNERNFDIKAVNPDEITDYDADIMITDTVRGAQAGYEIFFDSTYTEQMDAVGAINATTVILTTSESRASEKMKLVEKYLFTRRMFNAIDGCTDHMVVPAFDPK